MQTFEARKATGERNQYYLSSGRQIVNPARTLVGTGIYMGDSSGMRMPNSVNMAIPLVTDGVCTDWKRSQKFSYTGSTLSPFLLILNSTL
jgi:hypothetical protein